MALRAGYKGFKKLLPGLKIIRPGTLGIDNTELGKTFFPRSEQAVLGAKNLMPFPYYETTKTASGITFTVDENGVIDLDGTATGDVIFVLYDGRNKQDAPFRNLDIILSKGSLESNVSIWLNAYNGTTYLKPIVDLQGSLAKESQPFKIDYDGYDGIRCAISVVNGKVCNHVKIYPMIRLASDPDDTYATYDMTNKELTEKMTIKGVTVTAGTDVTVNANTHVYSEAGVVTGSLRLEIGATLTAGATIASLSAKPKNTTYAIGIDSTDKSVIPIIIGTDGAVYLFGSFVPTSGHQLLIPIAYVTA